ncbi:hypothetical protein R3W88_015072 [Solanum pinnatisectum]|uniref:Retrotransposon gag domain-containing protein n=1 Tax=Solanum pinnatisectum TaxID=50273 RepID=A0AAV9KVV0_9SOLN|nr:hypothetical protein R3W88_015072 [Solanum pinnatisectum]
MLNSSFSFNAPVDGRPPLHFSPLNAEQAQNPPSNPAQNPPIIDLTAPNPHHASISYQVPPPPQNANLQTGSPPQNQHINNPQTSFRHQNQHTNPQNFHQNYQATPNAQSPSIAPPLPQKAIFQIPVPKFDVFGGTGNPLAHLRAYCDQLVGVGRDETLLMWLFSRSLSGETLEWFTSHETRSGLAGMLWLKTLLNDSLTMWRLFLIVIP